MAEERLQKFLAAAGVASRRKAEALITAGRVKVNQRVVHELGTKVDPEKDLVVLDGKLVSAPSAKSYYLLYKPTGCVTTASDPEGRPTAQQYLHGVKARVFPVGRLDYDAEGALVYTDDGELANRLAHPRYGHERIYLVKVRGEPDPRALERMAAGVRLEDGPAHALQVGIHERAEKNVWIRVVVGEGRYHLVKRLCEAVGLMVQRLFRPEFGGVTVEGLRAGEYRELTPLEVKSMRQRVGLIAGSATPPPPPRKLPRAARRHGHGPPPAPGTEPAEQDPQSETEGEAAGPRERHAAEDRSHGGRERRPAERKSQGGRERPSGERRGQGGREHPSAERRGQGGREHPSAERRGQGGRERPSGERRGQGGRERQPAEGRNHGGSARTRVPPERIPAKKSVKKW